MNTRQSIRSKTIRIILTISSVSLLTAFAILYAYEIYSYRQTVTKQLTIQANMLAKNAAAALAFGDTEEALDLLQSLKSEPNILGAALYKHDSSLFLYDAADAAPSFAPGSTINHIHQQSTEAFEIVVPVEQDNKLLGWLYIKRSDTDVIEKNFVYLSVVFGVLLLCIFLTYVLSRRFERSISKPIIDLADTAKSISEKHDYSVRSQIHPDGELNVLTTAFNLMLSRIDEQNRLIQKHNQELEVKVEERTIEIKHQRDFAETIINSSLILIAVFDNEMRFIHFNKRCEIEFGMRSEDVLGKRFADVMPAAIGSPAYKSVIRALNGQVAHYEQYRSPVSNEYYENFGIPLFNENNEVYAAILTAHNITATVVANESLLRSNEELKRKNADLEQFAYVASHDLQEPLRKIQIFTDMAKKALDTAADASKYFEKIERSAQRMRRLIKDVLEYSRLARVEESFVDTDLNVIVEYIKSDFELLIEEKNALVENEELPVIRGNKLQLHQLFANLVSNGLKFNDGKPHIKIKAEIINGNDCVGFTPIPGKKYYRLAVIDNGIGFDMQYKEKLFTIFQRLNSKDNYEGTGVGLALCKKIVENHSGFIDVVSVPQQGSVFTVILPSN